ncbi:MAG: hypothetical protein HQK62_13660 [Desulfamplus sp.]|nr:hypothetical protein [Desulfamplus sp.]
MRITVLLALCVCVLFSTTIIYGGVRYWVDDNGIKHFEAGPQTAQEKEREQKALLEAKDIEQRAISNSTTKEVSYDKEPQVLDNSTNSEQPPAPVNFSGSCGIVTVSEYENQNISGGTIVNMHGGTGTVVGQSISSSPCAAVTIKNVSRGSRLSGKLILTFIDGKKKVKDFQCDRIPENGLTTIDICWRPKEVVKDITCEF